MKTGFIGLGRMGQEMARRLLKAGHTVVLFNRTPSKLNELAAEGGVIAGSIGEAAAEGVVITMLADDKALKAVADDPGGVIETLPRGGLHIAMGTHDVRVIRDLAAAHAAAGQTLISAPVLGRPEAVAAGRLGIIAGGPPEALDRCRPLLEAIGRRTFEAGPDPSAAAAMKLANNLLLACAIEAIGEVFSLVEKCGVDGRVFHDVVTDGLFASPAYNAYAKIICEKDYDQVGFTATLALKDVTLAMSAGEIAGVPLPSANVCRDRLLGAIAHGDAERDWSVMALEQARASGLA